jgi:hypothetical protein
MSHYHLPNPLRIKIKEMLSRDPSLLPKQIEAKLGKSFSDVQLKSLGALRGYFIKTHHHSEKISPFRVSTVSNLSAKFQIKAKQMFTDHPDMTAMDVAKVLKIKNARHVKSLSNIKANLKHIPESASDNQPERAVRQYKRHSNNVMMLKMTTFPTKGLSKKTIVVLKKFATFMNQIPTVDIVEVVSPEKGLEVRQKVST